ncbi:hypothetical protein SETIT_6G154900v2 [Setaria italica]|uniref:Myb/SANT-like domain-containing protein n=1 Tax=Setaria italica TaxID=4555 RepID=A0A368RLX7_SETIT|nr:hypothetical protein SETIT_6G154900v2 [Setaria italica]
MVKEFHLRNKFISYTKAQIQDKEDQLKRDYKMLKAARMQSGSKCNEKRNMVEGPPAMWDNLIVKFQNNKASFPLYDDLGELCDGHLAEGTYNFTSIESQREEEPLHQIHDVEHGAEADEEPLQEIHEVRDEDDEEKEARDEEKEAREKESDAAAVETSGQRRTAAPRKKSEKEEQRPRKSTKIEGTMERYLEMRAKQAEDEAAQLAREKKVAKGDEFSIKRCISIVNAMEVIKQERAKAYAVFTKSKENKRHSYVPMK